MRRVKELKFFLNSLKIEKRRRARRFWSETLIEVYLRVMGIDR